MLHRFLASCRFLLIIPVIGCVLLTAGVVVMGIARLVTDAQTVLAKGDASAKAAKAMSLGVIEIIDLFLIGTVSYVTAVGLYKLFISSTEIPMPIRLKIESLNDLENKIIGILVAALAVAFLGHAAGGDEAGELLNYGGGIAVVIAALSLFLWTNLKSTKNKKTDNG